MKGRKNSNLSCCRPEPVPSEDDSNFYNPTEENIRQSPAHFVSRASPEESVAVHVVSGNINIRAELANTKPSHLQTLFMIKLTGMEVAAFIVRLVDSMLNPTTVVTIDCVRPKPAK